MTVRSREHDEVIDVTDRVARAVAESGVHTGLCHVYVSHTTAGVFINENADPDVIADRIAIFRPNIANALESATI